MSTQLIGLENLPNVYIEKVVLSDNNTETFKVNVNLELFDNFSGNNGFVWSADETFRSFIKVCLIYTKNAVVSGGLTKGTLSPLPKSLFPSGIVNDSSTKHLIYSMKEFAVSSDGNTLTFKNKASFVVDMSQNLDIFAFCFLDTQQISQTLKIDLSNQLSQYYGAISSEKIFVNGKIPKTTSFYVNPNKTLWTGPVHLYQGTYMQGSSHDTAGHSNVTRIVTENVKVLDNRTKSYKRRQSKKNKNVSLFSDAYYSIDNTGGLTGIFSFNVREFALSRTRYGSKFLGLSKALFEQFVSTIQISSLTITREQIKISKSSNILQTPQIKKIDLGSSYLVASSIEAQAGVLTEVSEDTAKLQQIYIDQGSSLRSYVFSDLSKNTKSYGDYRYEVEVAIIDKSQDFFNSQIVSAKQNYSALKDVVNSLNSNINYDYTLDKLKKDVVVPEEVSLGIQRYYDLMCMLDELPVSEMRTLITEKINLFSSGNYNARMAIKFLAEYEQLITRFTGNFKIISTQNVSYGKVNTRKDSIPNYIKVSKKFSEVISFSDYEVSYNYLGAEQAGLKVVTKEQYEAMASKNIDRYFDGSKSYIEDTLNSADPSIASAITDFSISKYLYFSPVSFNVGHKTANTTRLDEIDLLKLSNLFVEIIRTISYQKRKQKKYKMKKAVRRGASRVSPSFKKTKKKKTTFNFSFTPVVPPVDTSQIKDSLSPYIDSREYLGDNSEFPRAGEDLSIEVVSQNNLQILKNLTINSSTVVPRDKKIFDITKKNNIINKLKSSKKFSRKKLIYAPIPFKALLASRSPAARNNILESDTDILKDVETKVATEISFFAIQRIEVLTGYELDENGIKMLSKPVWKKITPEILNNNKRKICRMVYEENDELDIKIDENFKFPALDKIFIISDSSITSPLPSDLLPQEVQREIPLKNNLSRQIIYSTTNTVTQNNNKMAIFKQMPEETNTVQTQISLPTTDTVSTQPSSTPTSTMGSGGSTYGGY